MMIRGPFTEDTIEVAKQILDLGYQPATFLQFINHILFWRLQRRRQAKKFSISDNLSPEKKPELKK